MANCKNCFSKCLDNRYFKWLMASCVVVWIKRIMPLLTSIWMEVDMGLDVRQTLIYYDHAFNSNGTYSQWPLELKKTTNGTMETVHPGYFYTSIVVWVLPPFLFCAFWFLDNLCDDKVDPFFITKILFHEFSSIGLNPPFKKKYQNFLFSVFYFPFDLLISAIFIYIVIPFASLKSGIIIALKGGIDGKRKITKKMVAKHIPFLKLFENLGEAVPQSIMCLIFIINNFKFIIHEETSTWRPIPISIVSLVFSVGSIMMGLYTGCDSYKYIYNIFL